MKRKPARKRNKTEFDKSMDHLEALKAEAALTTDRRKGTPRRKETTILQTAERLIYGDRNKVYRHPSENFENIANLWNAYFNAIRVRPDVASGLEMRCFVVNKIDVAYLNILQKIARGATNQEHTDTIVDIAGYAGCIERIISNK